MLYLVKKSHAQDFVWMLNDLETEVNVEVVVCDWFKQNHMTCDKS